MIPALTRRAVARRGLAAALAGAVASLPGRVAAADPYRDLPPGIKKAEPELDSDWRRANDAYWRAYYARQAANAAYWANPAFGDANNYYWAHCAPGAPQPLDCAPKPAPAPAVPARQRVATLAPQYVGTPYVWGGETPDGWDCSGMTRWLYGRCGIAIPRTAAEQWDATTRVDPGPGDLVFFAVESGGIDHVGIYLGAGLMVSALNEDLGTRISAVFGAYWAPLYAGAGRV
ncbi:MAG TPA: C40 family peptidase [Thermomicrobiales bacterium]|nr:C40 family peptidase [Thermomicrobiales bacterium]